MFLIFKGTKQIRRDLQRALQSLHDKLDPSESEEKDAEVLKQENHLKKLKRATKEAEARAKHAKKMAKLRKQLASYEASEAEADAANRD